MQYSTLVWDWWSGLVLLMVVVWAFYNLAVVIITDNIDRNPGILMVQIMVESIIGAVMVFLATWLSTHASAMWLLMNW